MKPTTRLIILLAFNVQFVLGQGMSVDENMSIYSATIPFSKVIDSTSSTDFKRLHFDRAIKVFGLGEANHGTKEFQLLKWKLAEYLIRDGGINTVMIEFPYAHGLLLNDYVHGKNDDGLKILTDQENSEYKNVDFVGFINWIKSMNEGRNEEEKIAFLGGDIFGKPTAIRLLREYFTRVDSSKCNMFHRYRAIEQNTYFSAFKQDTRDFVKLSKTIRRTLIRNKSEYVNRSSLNDFDGALKLSEALRLQWKKNSRAEAFAKNVESVLLRNANAKILIIAHNRHVGKLRDDVGALLARRLGNKYFAIGTDYIEGSFSLFNLKDRNRQRVDTLYTPRLDSGFANAFLNLPGKFYYINLAALKKTELWQKREDYIASMGFGFAEDLLPIEFREKAILSEYFDGVFVFKKIHPIQRIK